MKISAITAAVFLAVAVLATPGAQAATNIVLAHHNALDSHLSKQGERFKSCVEAASKGALTVAHYPAGQLGTAREIVEQVKLGAVGMTLIDTAYMSNLQPELAVFQLPFMFTDWAHAERAMDGAPGDTVKKLLLEKQGIRVLQFQHNGFRDFMTISKPITTIDSFKGMKLRSPPIPTWVKMFELLGAMPVTVDWSEIYTAMQSNLVEGMETTPDGFVNSKTYEVGKFVTQTQHMYNLMMFAANEQKFKALTPTEQGIIADCAKDFRNKGNKEVIELNDKAYGFLSSKGIKILQIDKAPLRARLEPAWPQLVSNSKGAADLIDQIAKVK